MMGPVVTNSSPLIALDRIEHLGLLSQLFGKVLVPRAVVQEVEHGLSLPDWVQQLDVEQPVAAQVLKASLGSGESEAISLALERRARLVILDDRPARRLAQALGLVVTGTVGVLLAAKQRGYLKAVRPVLDALVASDFRIAPALYELVLRDAGEGA